MRQLKTIILNYVTGHEPIPSVAAHLIAAYSAIMQTKGEAEVYIGTAVEEKAREAYCKMFRRLDPSRDAASMLDIFQWPDAVPTNTPIPIDLIDDLAKMLAVQDHHIACCFRTKLLERRV